MGLGPGRRTDHCVGERFEQDVDPPFTTDTARKVRERLARFDADVVVWDPFVDDADLAAAGVRRAADLEEIFTESAIVSVHTPLIAGVTDQLITADLLARLRPGAVSSTPRAVRSSMKRLWSRCPDSVPMCWPSWT